MESILKEWDGESVIIRYDQPTGAWIFIAIHSTRLGPAVGGTRIKSYPNIQAALQDALRLAKGMTYKFAVPGMPWGGGKAVIAIPDGFDTRSRLGLFRRYGELIGQLGGLYNTAPDVGTTSNDMDIIAETGAPHVFGRTHAGGGSGSSGPATALGVFTGIKVACEYLFEEATVKNRQVLVQGAGSVGGALIEHLRAAGAKVTVSEVDEANINRYRDAAEIRFVPETEVYTTECDIFAPCALGSVLNATTIPQLKCQAVVGGANNQLAKPKDAENLKTKDILYAPDYVVNVGGAMAGLGQETLGWSRERADKEVVENIQHTLRQVFDLAAKKDITTEAAARQIAEEHLSPTK